MNQLSILEKKKANALKGIAAIGVMLGHITFVGDIFPIGGGLFVGLFFFFSGYGLLVSYQSKENYLDGFLTNKILKIYIPFVIAETAYTIAYYYVGNRMDEFRTIESIGKCLGIPLMNGILWYVWHILGIYLIFYVMYRFVKKKKLRIFIWIILYVIWCMVGVIGDLGTWWYMSSSCILIGLFAADKKELCIKFVNQTWIKWGVVSLFIVLVGIYEFVIFNKIRLELVSTGMLATGVSMLATPLFIVWLAIVLEKVKFNAKIWQKLGNISYEIYLWHMVAYIVIEYLWNTVSSKF